MIVLVALAVVCLALVFMLMQKGPRRALRGPGPFVSNWGRREMTEEEAARLTRAITDSKASSPKDSVT